MAIVGGTTAKKHEFPFIVSITAGGELLCGGSIISKHIVLTAAHCCTSKIKYVFAGQHRRNKGKRHKVQSFVKHPKFGSSGAGYDICLIKVTTEKHLRDGHF